MVVFELEKDTTYWFVGCVSCTGADRKHTAEIYEQLAAQEVGLPDEL